MQLEVTSSGGAASASAASGVPPRRLLSVQYAPNVPVVVVVGGNSGRVHVYRLLGSAATSKLLALTNDEQTEELYYIMHPERREMDV